MTNALAHRKAKYHPKVLTVSQQTKKGLGGWGAGNAPKSILSHMIQVFLTVFLKFLMKAPVKPYANRVIRG